MGLLSIIRKQKLKDKELRVVVLGLDNAGKTTIVKQLLGEYITTVSPTMGFQINSLVYQGYTLNLWDIGGQSSLRPFWGNYFENTNVVVWVIDALATERLNESYKELQQNIILQDRLVGVSLLVMVNKVDEVPEEDGRQLATQVIKLLNLDQEIPLDRWHVHLVSGKTGQGITDALNWCIQ